MGANLVLLGACGVLALLWRRERGRLRRARRAYLLRFSSMRTRLFEAEATADELYHRLLAQTLRTLDPTCMGHSDEVVLIAPKTARKEFPS